MIQDSIDAVMLGFVAVTSSGLIFLDFFCGDDCSVSDDESLDLDLLFDDGIDDFAFDFELCFGTNFDCVDVLPPPRDRPDVDAPLRCDLSFALESPPSSVEVLPLRRPLLPREALLLLRGREDFSDTVEAALDDRLFLDPPVFSDPAVFFESFAADFELFGRLTVRVLSLPLLDFVAAADFDFRPEPVLPAFSAERLVFFFVPALFLVTV